MICCKRKRRCGNCKRRFWGVCWVTFWVAGILFTCHHIRLSYSHYSHFPRMDITSRGNQGLTFPRIMVCSQSMHSRDRLAKTYPHVNDTLLSTFYGSFEGLQGLNREDWDEFVYNYSYVEKSQMAMQNLRDSAETNWTALNAINLTTFFYDSRPRYAVKKCRINRFDCRRHWHFDHNLMGSCLELDPTELMLRMGKTKKVSLGFTFGVNVSDQSFGWNGYMSGFGVYFYHFTKHQDIKSDQVLLSPDLAPVINIQNVKRTYLNHPYTKCIDTYATNDYGFLNETNPRPIYSDSGCIMNELANTLCEMCGCYPGYMERIDGVTIRPGCKGKQCNFFQHSTCVAGIINSYDWTHKNCLPPCVSYIFQIKSNQYIKMNPGYSTQRGFLYATAVFNLAEDQNIELTEETTYDLTELIADIGGAAGLILGLNLISLITVCSKSGLPKSRFINQYFP